MSDFWQRVEQQRPAGYWEDLFVTLRRRALSLLEPRIAGRETIFQGYALPTRNVEPSEDPRGGRRCRVVLHLLERLDESERASWLVELDKDAACDQLFVLMRVAPERPLPPLVGSLTEEVLGPWLEATELPRQVHLTTGFRLDSRATFERRRLRLDLLHFVRHEAGNH